MKMAQVVLSDSEKLYILNGIDENFRCDGRSLRDYRPMELETDLINNASGSARLRLANTDLLVGVKTEIDKPSKSFPNQGKIEFFVDCSANATPEFEGRGGEKLASELADTLYNAYQSPLAFDLEGLCILPGQYCWKLYVDILILQCGGNLFDAASIAAKAAIFNTRIPRLTSSLLDADEAELLISDDSRECNRISIGNIPVLVTVCKIGDSCIVDPSAEEEQCSSASVIVAVSKRNNKTYLSHTHIIGGGSLDEKTLFNCIKLGSSVGEQLDDILLKSLLLEEEKIGGKKLETFGFLK